MEEADWPIVQQNGIIDVRASKAFGFEIYVLHPCRTYSVRIGFSDSKADAIRTADKLAKYPKAAQAVADF